MLKTPWHDGTRDLLFEPLELIGRLTALIPRPHKNLLVYHGVLAPRAKWRSRVVAYGRPSTAAASVANAAPAPEVPPDRPARHRDREWATLMRRAFELDVLACPSCGSRLKLIACITDPAPSVASCATCTCRQMLPSHNPPARHRGHRTTPTPPPDRAAQRSELNRTRRAAPHPLVPNPRRGVQSQARRASSMPRQRPPPMRAVP